MWILILLFSLLVLGNNQVTLEKVTWDSKAIVFSLGCGVDDPDVCRKRIKTYTMWRKDDTGNYKQISMPELNEPKNIAVFFPSQISKNVIPSGINYFQACATGQSGYTFDCIKNYEVYIEDPIDLSKSEIEYNKEVIRGSDYTVKLTQKTSSGKDKTCGGDLIYMLVANVCYDEVNLYCKRDYSQTCYPNKIFSETFPLVLRMTCENGIYTGTYNLPNPYDPYDQIGFITIALYALRPGPLFAECYDTQTYDRDITRFLTFTTSEFHYNWYPYGKSCYEYICGRKCTYRATIRWFGAFVSPVTRTPAKYQLYVDDSLIMRFDSKFVIDQRTFAGNNVAKYFTGDLKRGTVYSARLEYLQYASSTIWAPAYLKLYWNGAKGGENYETFAQDERYFWNPDTTPDRKRTLETNIRVVCPPKMFQVGCKCNSCYFLCETCTSTSSDSCLTCATDVENSPKISSRTPCKCNQGFYPSASEGKCLGKIY